MAIRDLFGLRSTANPSSKSEIKAQLNPPVMDMPFSTWYGGNSYGGYNNFASAILRQDAVGVPSITRCRNLICGTIATIPLEMYSLSTGEELPSLTWVDQPDKRQPRAVTISWTVDSLFMYGVAYWRVEEVYADDNRPARFSWIQNDRVTVKYNALNTEVEYYMINNIRVPDSGVGSLVTFQALDQGLLLRKQYFATELARACNIPAYMIDAETFRGMTYQNIIDGRKEFFAYSLAPFVTAIEDRLSMDDLTPRGQTVRFSVDETFLRVDPLTRLQVTEKLLTLGLIDVEQAKEMEDLTPEGSGEYDPTDL